MKHVRDVTPEGIEKRWRFDLIHWTALTSLLISFISCVIVLVLIIVRDAKVRGFKAFFKRPIGDRLVVYRSGDKLFTVQRLTYHGSAYMSAARAFPLDVACAAFGFLSSWWLRR